VARDIDDTILTTEVMATKIETVGLAADALPDRKSASLGLTNGNQDRGVTHSTSQCLGSDQLSRSRPSRLSGAPRTIRYRPTDGDPVLSPQRVATLAESTGVGVGVIRFVDGFAALDARRPSNSAYEASSAKDRCGGATDLCPKTASAVPLL
jgi:hypothetical protein